MSETSPEAWELVRRAVAGDDDAFRRLVRGVYPDLQRWALARTGDPDAADEVVQRALIRMHRSLDTFSGRSKLTTWLYRIVANAATDLHRSRDARPTTGLETAESRALGEHEPDALAAVHARRMAAVVRDYLGGLPPRQREVLELVDHQGLTPAEVGDVLGLKAVTVRANLFRARRALRTKVLERYPELMEGYER